LQGVGVFSVVVGLYDDLHVLIEGDEEAQKALDGKLAEVASQHLGDIRLADAEQGGGFDLFQGTLFHDRIDLENQLCFDKVLFGVRQAEVLEHVAASDFVFPLRGEISLCPRRSKSQSTRHLRIPPLRQAQGGLLRKERARMGHPLWGCARKHR
jgi:hypothetical protein